jgi:two-component system, chemotaxis family, sensor kinase Cph1
VIAEDKATDAHSYLRHTFPAADIPAQARALYTRNTVRLIPDVGYAASPIIPAVLPTNGLPIDLTSVTLRSVSPVHLEYLTNMGVAASMSISLVRDGQLWALVACHHSSPRLLTFLVLEGCDLLVQAAAAHLDTQERTATAQCVAAVRRLEAELTARADDHEDFRDRLRPIAPELLGLTKSQGLVICDDQAVWTVGEVPTHEQISALFQWLRSTGKDRITTDCLSARFAPASLYRGIASGIAAARIGVRWGIWVRAEWGHTLAWAGEPETATGVAEQRGRINPRKSFASWLQQVRGRSRPWTAPDLLAVAEVRMLLLRIMMDDTLRQDFQRRRLESIGQMAGGLAHELNSLLQPIVSMAQIAQEDHRADAELNDAMTVILNSAKRAAEIVHDMLVYVRPPTKECRHLWLANAVTGELDAMRRTLPPRIRLDLCTDGAAGWVRIPSGELGQTIKNLVDNAIHAVEGDGEVTVHVDDVHVSDTEAVRMQMRAGRYGRISVSDNGPGISHTLLDRIFEPFFTTKDVGQGTGLGLSIVQGIVRSCGGSIAARNLPERGAVFEIMLPSFDAPAVTDGGRRAGDARGRRQRERGGTR